MKQKKLTDKKDIPEGILILSFVIFASAVLSLIGGSLFISLADSPKELLQSFNLSSGILLFVGILFLASATLNYFIAKGLMSKKRWSWLIMLIFSGFSIILNIINLFNQAFYSSSFGILFSGLIFWYLINPKTAKHYN
ncbi:MAG: hypothetical protein PHX15_02535 [Candidatus Nanoarchaeia archaeon]|nr:hypothetical protein [Candidatus Nanoarchaeia archaeon]MDD3994048.1 hypothetical protein [Candidatus Nanoarchaeia archaeon]MDD4563336.1 hypothetical protein [Candidatus Nanoarchaeia archaeon]